VIGDDIGKFLAVAKDTLCRTRPGVARLCAEVNIHEDLPTSIWLEGLNYPGFWQPIYYPNFLYCSHCYKIGHSLANCYKKNGKPVDKGKQLENAQPNRPITLDKPGQGHWQTQRAKKVYRQVADHNNDAGTSGAKNLQGQEVDLNHEKVLATNSFAALNLEDEEEIPIQGSDTVNNEGPTKEMTVDETKGKDSMHIEAQGITKFVDEIFLEAQSLPLQEPGREVLAGLDKEAALNSVATLKPIMEEHPADCTDQVDENTNEEQQVEHVQVTPLAMVPRDQNIQNLEPGDTTQQDPFLLTNGEEEYSADEDEDLLTTTEIITCSSDSEVQTKKKKHVTFSMCTRSKTNPNGSSKKSSCRCCEQ
ncbi:hypothetical protein FRX31_006619, partial [Thalictrum thalictroides]